MNKSTVIQLIENLKSLNLKNTPSLVIEKQLEPLLEFQLPIIKINKGSIAVRTRIIEKNEAIFTKISEISYRTKNVEKIGKGRCNDDGEPVFYCSLETERLKPIQTNILEIFPRFDDETIAPIIQTISGKSQFQCDCYFPFIGGFKNNPNLCNAGHDRFNFLDKLYKEYDSEYIECFKIVDEFLCNEFSKKVKNEYEYKISATYSKMIHAKDRIGIVYPSVNSNQAGLNIAIYKESVDLGIIQCRMAIYSKFYTRNKNIVNEHLMIANIDKGFLRWYEDYNHKLPPIMKKYFSGESEDDSFLKYIHFEDLGD